MIMNSNKTHIQVRNSLGYFVNSNILVGDSGNYTSGDLMDANAVEKLIDDKIAAVIGGASAALDTLKELGDAIPTKTSDLTNDSGFITESNGQLQVNTTNISVISNQPFPASWPTNSQHTLSDLVAAIDADSDAIKGKVYLSTVHYSDLPGDMADAELKVEIMDVRSSDKIAVFTITSANVSPYNWHATMWNNTLTAWRSYALVEEESVL